MHALAKMPSAMGTAVQEYVRMPSNASTNPRLDMPAQTVCARASTPTMPFSIAVASSTTDASGSISRDRCGVRRVPQRRNHSGCVRYTLTSPRRSVNTSVGKSAMASMGEDGPSVEPMEAEGR